MDDHSKEDDIFMSSWNYHSSDEEMEPRERTRRDLERNNPCLADLVVGAQEAMLGGGDHYYPYDDDWWRDGRSIGQHEHLEILRLMALTDSHHHHFFGGLIQNRSIRQLTLDNCDHEIITSLFPFFEENGNLRRLDILFDRVDQLREVIQNNNENVKARAIEYIGTALDKARGTQIESLRLTGCGFDHLQFLWGGMPPLRSGPLERFFSSLAGLSTLKSLVLKQVCSTEPEGADLSEALAGYLRHANCALKHLDVSKNGFDDDSIVVLVDALAEEGNTVEELILAGCRSIKLRGWRAVVSLLRVPHSRIKTFACPRTDGISYVANGIANCIADNTTLVELDLSCLGTVGGPNLGPLSIINLANSVIRNNTLKCLRLECTRFTDRGFEALIAWLSGPACALNSLSLYRSIITDYYAELLAGAITRNRSLTFLDLTTVDQHSEFDVSKWELFAKALCDPTSIDSTYRSNHTLEVMEDGVLWCGPRNEYYKYYDDVILSLEINRGSQSLSTAARSKIIKHHFREGNFTVEPFADMDPGFVPHALEWMGRHIQSHSSTRRWENDEALSRLYKIVLNISNRVVGEESRRKGQSSNKKPRLG